MVDAWGDAGPAAVNAASWAEESGVGGWWGGGKGAAFCWSVLDDGAFDGL